MSIHRVDRKGGTRYKVVWRDERHAYRSRTFSLKRDAEAWEAQIKLAKRQGELAALDAGKQTLEAFASEWWKRHAEPNLSAKTQQLYRSLCERLMYPRLGHLPLRALTPERITDFRLALEKDGVGKETIRKTLAMLQGMLERAVEWGRLSRNPARYVRKPPQGRTLTVKPMSPAEVEKLRQEMIRREWC